ncbi:MAG: 30S ribosomal protein S6e [Hadesarchaea archaeon]|nr:30S ribosomal protein S6e [Hadesarchaea archaeon]
MVKIVISDPSTGKAYQVEVDETRFRKLVGLRIGDKFGGELIGLSGYELQITGGTDKDGFPMRFDVMAPRRARVLISSPPGFRPKMEGERRRKMVHGGTVSPTIVQLNTKVAKGGNKPLEEILRPEAVGEEEKKSEASEEKSS